MRWPDCAIHRYFKLVGEAGFEPATSCSRNKSATRPRPSPLKFSADFFNRNRFIKMVGKVRFELTHFITPSHEPSPLGHFPMFACAPALRNKFQRSQESNLLRVLVGTPRIELDSLAFQTSAMTTLARCPKLSGSLSCDARPVTPSPLRRYR